jgi:hypothetical protein
LTGDVTLTQAEIRRILKQREKNARRKEKRREERGQVVELVEQGGEGQREEREVHYDGGDEIPPLDSLAPWLRILIISLRPMEYKMQQVSGIPRPRG